MQVAAKVTESAKTELSQDSNVLVVHRFDVDEIGKLFGAMEDFCAPLHSREDARLAPLHDCEFNALFRGFARSDEWHPSQVRTRIPWSDARPRNRHRGNFA
jgi:hypothetical protein